MSPRPQRRPDARHRAIAQIGRRVVLLGGQIARHNSTMGQIVVRAGRGVGTALLSADAREIADATRLARAYGAIAAVTVHVLGELEKFDGAPHAALRAEAWAISSRASNIATYLDRIGANVDGLDEALAEITQRARRWRQRARLLAGGWR